MKKLFFLALFFVLTGCNTYSETDKTGFDQRIRKFTEGSGISYTRSESGLYYFIEKEGEGEPIKFTDEVTFTYTGKLLNGRTFDGEHSKNPVTFRVSELIEGWKEAMLYLRKGGKARLVVPPQLGYGDYDLDDIPKNSILVFDMEVVDVK